MKKNSLIITVFAILALAVVPAFAQLNPFAPPEASAPLVESSPSGGLTPSTYTSRAEAAVEGASAPRGALSAPAISAERSLESGPFGDSKESFGPQPSSPIDSAPSAISAPAMPAVQTPAIRWVKVLTGERVKCAVCERILEDVHYERVPETMLKDNFFDDGTNGDQEAGDGLYTNITERSDVLGPECNRIKEQLLSLLLTSEEMTPLEFFGLHSTTNEPISYIPKNMTKEMQRDERLKEWNRKFLRPYRKNPDDPTSEFYAIYVPRPPKAPINNPIMPAAWNPVEIDKQREAAEQAEAGITGGYTGGSAASAIEGSPQGGHQGRYYDASKMP